MLEHLKISDLKLTPQLQSGGLTRIDFLELIKTLICEIRATCPLSFWRIRGLNLINKRERKDEKHRFYRTWHHGQTHGQKSAEGGL
jgi:hypothetical protein